MIVSRVSKTALHQMVSPFAIAPRRDAVRLSACCIQGCLFFVPLDCSPMGRASALSPQHASRTHSGGGLVFNRPTNRMHPPRFEHLARWTKINIFARIVSKGVVAKDRVIVSAVSFHPGIPHVRRYAALVAPYEVLTRAILVIRHHNLRLRARVFLVLIY